jgi:hypothetical protein
MPWQWLAQVSGILQSSWTGELVVVRLDWAYQLELCLVARHCQACQAVSC